MEKIVLNRNTPVMDVEQLISLGADTAALMTIHTVNGEQRIRIQFTNGKQHRCFVGESLYFRKRSGTGETSTWAMYGETEVKVLSIIDEYTIEVSVPTGNDSYTIVSADSANKTITLNKNYPLLPEDFYDVGFDFGAKLYDYNSSTSAETTLQYLYPVFRHDSSTEFNYDKQNYDRSYINTIDFGVSEGVNNLPKVTGYTYTTCDENAASIKYDVLPKDKDITADYPPYIYVTECNEYGEEERTDYQKTVTEEFDYVALSGMPLYIEQNPYLDFKEATAEESDAVELYSTTEFIRKKEYYEVKVGLSTDDELNLLQQNTVQDFFSQEIKEKSIPEILDMEKVMFEPWYNDTAVEELEFNFHFRTRLANYFQLTDYIDPMVYSTAVQRMSPIDPTNPISSPKYVYESTDSGTKYWERRYTDGWMINDGIMRGWNGISAGTSVTDNRTFKNKEAQSDLLGCLDFSDDDVRYQKEKIKRSFIRLSFYDSDNPLEQQLLGYSTIFLDSNDLAGKFYKNRQTNKTFGVDTTGATEEERLSTQLTVKDKYNTKKSSEGFYIYLFKNEVDEVNTEKTIYMKVEFNHAGKGKTLPFMKPYITTTASTASDEGDSVEPGPPDENKYIQAVPFDKYFKYLYIKIKVKYLANSEPHYVYYIDEDLSNVVGNPIKYDSTNKKIIFCLYEPLI